MRLRARKGFTLTELLTSMIIQAMFVITLCGAFYLLLSFGTRTQAIFTARERGQRVITFVENRVRNAGLGLHELKKVTDVQKAMKPLTDDGKPLYNSRKIDTITGLRLPVAISYSDQWPRVYTSKTTNDIVTSNPYKTEDNETKQKIMWHGNILTILYAQREDSNNVNLVIVTEKVPKGGINYDNLYDEIMNALAENDEFWTKQFTDTFKKVQIDSIKNAIDYYNNQKNSNSIRDAAEETLNKLAIFSNPPTNEQKAKNLIEVIDKNLISDSYFEIEYKFISEDINMFKNSQFGEGHNSNNNVNSNDIRGWSVMAGTGVPIQISHDVGEKQKINLSFDSNFKINTGDELLYLKADRMFVNDSDGEQNFCFQTLKDDWSDVHPHEKGILGIYFQLDIRNNILDLWVLATGGKDDIKHNYPAEWAALKNARPTKDQWEKNCPYEITYVSHASWKLHNIPEGFNWTN